MKQGEIWQINLDPTVGAEIQKTRPALIVNVDALGKLPLGIVQPEILARAQKAIALVIGHI
ncbi:MAG: type II toxin-antitoxin system PemK/MazF family toxin [Treponema sp.]|jgi:mRNA interferase MazF|nr:type II toxin-antitoxin system PemK/MazF family toxin [Treponema sp.]